VRLVPGGNLQRCCAAVSRELSKVVPWLTSW